MTTRRNLATDPRGSGTADWDLDGFTEAAGAPLAGFATSRAFTRQDAASRGDTVTNLAFLNGNVGTTTGAVTSDLTDEVRRVTYTTQGNTSWSDSLVFRPAQVSNSTLTARVPVTAGQKIYGHTEFRAGSRPRSVRWRLTFYSSTGGTVASYNSPYSALAGPDDWVADVLDGYVVPADAAWASIALGSGPTSESPHGFLGGEYMEFRHLIITVDQPFPWFGFFDGATPDLPATDEQPGADFEWTAPDKVAAQQSPSKATMLAQHRLSLPIQLDPDQDTVIRLKARASAPMPGGRLVLRPTPDDPTGEVEAVAALDLPAGESSIDVAAVTGSAGATSVTFLWGDATGGPAGTQLELTGWLVEPTTEPVDPDLRYYFDGWTLDIPATAILEGVDFSWDGVPQASTSTAVTTPVVKNETRQAIAQALSSIDGVTGYPTAPRTLGRGQGWPVWQSRAPLTMTGDEIRWLVHVTLPAGLLESTALEAEDLTDWVLHALSQVGVIEQIEPDALASVQADGTQPVPALTVTMTTTT